MADKKSKRKLSRKRHAPSKGTVNAEPGMINEVMPKPNETDATVLAVPLVEKTVQDPTHEPVSTPQDPSEVPPRPVAKGVKRMNTEEQTDTKTLPQLADSGVDVPSRDVRKRVRKRQRVAKPLDVPNTTVDKDRTVKVELLETPPETKLSLDHAIERVLRTAASNVLQRVGGPKKKTRLTSHIDRIIELTNQRIKEVMEAREPNIKVKKSNEERESPVKESSKSDKLEVKGEQETVPEGHIPGDEEMKSMRVKPTQHIFNTTDVEKLHPKLQDLFSLASSENASDNIILHDRSLNHDTKPIVRDAAFSQIKKRLGIGLARAEVSTRSSEELVSRVVRGAWLVLERCVSVEERAEMQRMCNCSPRR